MTEEDDGLDEGAKKTKNPLYVLKEEKFEGKTVYESYWYNRHRKANTPEDKYDRLCDVIVDGAQLLFVLLQTNKIEENDKAKINALYEYASNVILNEVPEKSTQKVQWADPAAKHFETVILTARDGGDTAFQPELYEKSEQRFEKTQFWAHIKVLRKVDFQIYNFLVKYGVIPTTRPTSDIVEELGKKELLEGMN